jgi:hypothetical protein
MISSASHAGLAGYLLRNRIETGPPRADGAVALVFDGSIRVLLHPGRRGELVAEAQLCTLEFVPVSDERTMLAALSVAAERPLHEATRLVLSPDEDRLVLQASIAPDASADEFERALARFLDAVNAWRRHFGTI